VATKKKTGWGASTSLGSSLAAAASAPKFTAAPTDQPPPPGYYDPALDAQGRASDRGLAQMLQDLGKQGTRAEDQYTIDKGQINQGADWSLADLLRGSQREGADFTQSTGRLNQDHGTNLADILRNYQRLGTSQAGAATAAGVGSGGTFAAAKAARDANQGLDQTAENTQFGRAMTDATTAHTRFGEDNTTSVDRTNVSRNQQLGDAGRLYGYGVVDRGDAAQRGSTENTFFNQDLGASKLYQAGQQGYVAPGTPLPNYENYSISKKKKTGTVVGSSSGNVPAAYY
jgi:hypothetical protein